MYIIVKVEFVVSACVSNIFYTKIQIVNTSEGVFRIK